MTREEAKHIVDIAFGVAKAVRRVGEERTYFEDEIREAKNMAIKALEQEPCEDCVSRQAVIDSIRNYFHDEYYQRTSIQDCRDCLIEDVIKPLPSDTPQTKTGHWIRFKEFENGYYHIKCSECGQYWSVDGHAKIFRYCFNCGAKMEEVEE